VRVEDSSNLGQDGREGRERAERLFADIYDLVVFVFGAKALPITLAGVIHDAIMAWASDAAEHRGRQQKRYATSRALPTLEVPRLIELARRNAEVRAGLHAAVQAVTTAAWELSGISPNDDKAWSAAIQAFNQAMWRLHNWSGEQLRLATEHARLQRTRAVDTIIENRPAQLRRPTQTTFARRFDEAVRKRAETNTAAPAGTAAGGPRSVAAETSRVLRSQRPNDDNRSDARPEGGTRRNPDRDRVRAGRRWVTPRADASGRGRGFDSWDR
jgi:hypothetical protein